MAQVQGESTNGRLASRQGIELPTRDEALNVLDLESQQSNGDEEEGWISMCERQQSDARLLVAPRFTNIHAFCIRSRADRILTLYAELRRVLRAGEEITELSKSLEEQILEYDRYVLQTSQVLALKQPKSLFLRHLLRSFKSALKGENTSHLDEPVDDWASLSWHDRLDELIFLVPLHKVGRLVFKPFLARKERLGNTTLYHYHESAMRSIIFTVFLFIIGVFCCAPAAIQSLNVESAAGEVAVYLVFVIAFGWLIQGLVQGFEKLLLTSLAFAGLMANLLRGDK
ncbi:hypothetical protein FHETE_1483 [Fusarium heterosporum]|uniref:DUF6594 domain-containing protein n=1 Tax=Fusarium heterosporum TaxID=42747 RepID=A0A8H5TWI1_FUSHE|nr:hypothetical protein FHETE_1483 [Fusarium heterosporum]